MSGESPAAILFDVNGNPVLVSSDGEYQLSVIDEEARSLLKQLLTEARITNAMLREALDIKIEAQDVE